MAFTSWERARSVVGATICVWGLSCAQPEDKNFEPGDENDPIVRAVAQQALSTQSSVTVTMKNGSGYAFTQGLLLLSQPFTVGAAPSTALINFVQDSSTAAGNATTFANALGLTIGTNAFVVPALNNGASAAVTISVPATAQVTYIARVAASYDDFVATAPVSLTSGAPGAVVASLTGYDLRSSSGPPKVTLGNGTTGQTPRSTTLTVLDTSDCPAGVLSAKQTLLSDDFAAGSGSTAWPAAFGWDGEFGGDWYTDGVTARVYNPNWGGASPSAPIPTVTGFWKRIDVCPASGSLLQFTAKVTSSYTDSTSDATLVLYFFDRGGNLLSTSANHPMFDQNDRTIAIYDAAIPASTRQIAVAPMARLGTAEQGDIFFDRVKVDYEPGTAFTNTSLATDDFSKSVGNGTPKNWAEFGGDWYRLSANNWATLGNPTWSGGTAGVDTGMTQTFSLNGPAAGDLLNARVFAAATFTDYRSFVRLRAIFNNSTVPVESDRQVRGYGFVDLRRIAIPAGATSVTIVINAYLGPSETSSLYVDDFSLARTHPN